jgi:hypothetical protein
MAMKTLRILALAALAAPVAFAQTYYYPRNDYPLPREELRRCMDRDEVLARRQADLEAEKRMNDRESDSIARASAQLAEELRRVNPADATAVAAHNARTADHNTRVEAHNLRVHDMNAAARALNRDQADMQGSCGVRSFYPEDRDSILMERRYR